MSSSIRNPQSGIRNPALLLLVAFLAFPIAPALAGAEDARAILERDWERQLELRFGDAALGPDAIAPTAAGDAAGAVDGVIDGKYGFHTDKQDGPWWQVDLQTPAALERIVIYNRGDRGSALRATRIAVSLSLDGKSWEKIYTHNGTIFLGFPDHKPLSVAAKGRTARFVRLSLPGSTYLHLDEVQVFDAKGANLALRKPALQSSVSNWSVTHAAEPARRAVDVRSAIRVTLERGAKLAADLKGSGVETAGYAREAGALAARLKALPSTATETDAKKLYFDARAAVRGLALKNPLLDFDRMLVTKFVPGSFTHMSDQYLGWWSRPGGGLFVLSDLKSGHPRETNIAPGLAAGSVQRPILSWDGKRILFSWCRYYPEVAAIPNKLDKAALHEDSFYHLYEINSDGTGLRQLTHGKYNDFDGRYLPDGRVVFLSTRRGPTTQYGRAESLLTMSQPELGEAYVRCGGGPERPCAVYTLHTMAADGSGITAISPFEMFEWTPAIANDGSILYARWDYIDRYNMPYMKLWRTNPDGTNPTHVFGNYISAPHTGFEPRPIPGSPKIVFTAGAHHSITAGSLVLIDPAREAEGAAAMTRLTPEVPFPESETGQRAIQHYYCSPWPLSEKYYLASWSYKPLVVWPAPGPNSADSLGVYLYDAFGNLELLYRDESINTLHAMPLRASAPPPVIQSQLPPEAPPVGRFLLGNVYASQRTMPKGVKIERLRIVAVPPKTHPTMNKPSIGVMHDDPGKCVLGTVPVEADGSAYFEAPACVTLFFQALDKDGAVVQTMRSATYLQPGQTLSCVGCHAPGGQAPTRPMTPAAARRAPSRIAPGPAGSWPLRFDRLVLPVMQGACAACHNGKRAFPAEPAKAWAALTQSGKKPTVADLVIKQYREPYSTPGQTVASASPLMAHWRDLKKKGKLGAGDFERLVTWLDVYGQFAGQFSEEQERDLERLKAEWTRQGIIESATEKAKLAAK